MSSVNVSCQESSTKRMIDTHNLLLERDLISSLPVVDLTKESVADLTKACDRSELTTIHNFDGASSISLRRVYEYNHASTDPADWTRISEPGEEPELFVKAPPAPIIGAL